MSAAVGVPIMLQHCSEQECLKRYWQH